MILYEAPPQTAQQVPWEALRYITGFIHYGGRVTDEWDRRCLLSVLETFFSEGALATDFSYGPGAPSTLLEGVEGENYLAPATGELEDYRSYVERLPLDDDVSVFGLQQSAQVSCGLAESGALLRIIVGMQPRFSASAAGSSEEQRVTALAAQLQNDRPSELTRVEAGGYSIPSAEKGDGAASSLQLVLLHEMERINGLLGLVAATLRDLQLAIAGTLLMTPALERMCSAISVNEVREIICFDVGERMALMTPLANLSLP